METMEKTDLVEVSIRNSEREVGIKESGDGVFCWINGMREGKHKVIINGHINWLEICKSMMLSGMPKGAMIKALLFGARAKVESRNI